MMADDRVSKISGGATSKNGMSGMTDPTIADKPTMAALFNAPLSSTGAKCNSSAIITDNQVSSFEQMMSTT